MICYNCGLKIHSTKTKECHFCGVKFGFQCSNCKTPNPTMAKFCFNCGSQQSVIKDASSIQNYSVLTESRKNVAILFADVTGFTALSEKLDPEILREIINDCFNYITVPVYELGGIIDKYIGDCVMVLFGAKTSHVDDTKRAVLCAMKMSKLIKEFCAQRIKPLGFDLHISIGVHYGLVVTGRIGNLYDMDYTVMGDTVNIAQRIQSNTPKSCIYVSEAVYRETDFDITYEGPITINAKNKENPIVCYMPTSIKRPLINTNELLPFVGRQSSLNELLDAKKAIESPECESSLIIGISGSSGIGKSALAERFLHLFKEDVRIIRTECNSSLFNIPYSLITNLLMNIMNINSTETLIVKQSRIISYISYVMAKYEDDEVKRNYQFISFLMGMEVDKETRDIISSMDAKVIFHEVASQLVLLFTEFENNFQSVILIEDIHFADTKSLSLLKEIWSGNTSRKGKNLYIYTTRNAIECLEELHQNKSKFIGLSPLDARGVSEYIKLYIGCDKVEDSCSDYILNFSGGNPLYLYELLKYIKTKSLFSISDNTVSLNKDIEKIPNSLQGLILSKLNYISEEATEVIQAASIIGKTFTTSVLDKLLGKNAESGDFLKEAENSNIIYLKSTYTHGGSREKLFSFSHDKERETIYNSILNKKKAYYHKEAARAIEAIYSRNLENYYEVLGEHFEKGDEPLSAASYYSYAAEHYKRLFNTQDALLYFLRAYNCKSVLKQASKDKLYYICLQLGELYTIMSDFSKAKSFLNKALKYTEDINEKWAVELDIAKIYKEQSKYKEAMTILNHLEEIMKQNNKLYGSLLFLKCNIQRVTGKQQLALENIKKAESILLKNRDYETLAKVFNAAGVIYHTSSDIDNALKSYLKAYKYSEKNGDLLTLVKCTGNMATIFHIQGDLNNAMKYFNIALELSKKISHLQSYVTNCNNLGVLYMDKGQFERAKELFGEAAKIAKETSTLFMLSASLSNLTDIEYFLGHYDQGVEYAREALEISIEIGDIEGEGINNISLAKISIDQARLQDAQNYLAEAYRIYCELNTDDGWSDYYYYLGQCSMELGELSEAMSYAIISKELSIKCQNSRKQAKAHRLIGILHYRLEDYISSIGCYDTSLELLEKEEALYEMIKSLYLRAIIYRKLGNIDAAQKDLKLVKSYSNKIDGCKWTKVIEHGIN